MIRYCLPIMLLLTNLFCYSQNRVPALNVGDKCPDITFNKVINFDKNCIRLSDYIGKSVIIDIWAPWCTPCIKSMTHLDSLQEQFRDKLVVVRVSRDDSEYCSKVLGSLKTSGKIKNVVSAVENRIMKQYFPHQIVPHYVWIDQNGYIKAITGAEELTTGNIQSLVNGEFVNVAIKKDIRDYDFEKPFFAGRQIDLDNQLNYFSILTKYIPNPPGGSTRRSNWIHCSNHSILLLYKIAFGEFNLALLNNNRVILEGFRSLDDSIQIGRLTDSDKWQRHYRDFVYSYEIVVPDSIYSTSEMFEFMRQDLNRYFGKLGIAGRMEERQTKVLELVRTSNVDKLKTRGGRQKNQHGESFIKMTNMPIGILVENLQSYYDNENLLPILNKSDYYDNIDIEINFKNATVEEINVSLSKYDLKLKESVSKLKFIVVTKRPVFNHETTYTKH